MKLYLVQHGKAVDKSVDAARPLSGEGTVEVECIADFLAPRNLAVGKVWHSGKARALQTAQLLATRVACDEALEQHDGFAPNDDVKPVAHELAGMSSDVMIVGHLPFMSKLASLLLSGDETRNVVKFINAGVLCLDRSAEGEWSVCGYVLPELVQS